MQTKYITFLVISFLISSCIGKTIVPTSNWILDIKNENGTDAPIVLKPNVLTKIIFIVRHEDDLELYDRSFDKSDFTIELEDDDDIKLLDDEIHIIPSISLEYSYYIGLKCDHDIKENTYELKFKVKKVKDLDDHDLEDATLTINPIEVEISDEKRIIEIEPIVTNLTGKGYSLFKLKNEIYNMEKVVITTSNKDNDNYKFKDTEIDAYKDREEFGENENNHGILIDFPFGTEKKYENLGGKTNYTFNLIMKKNDICSSRFILSESSSTVNITINNNELLILNDSVKEAIIYNMENITPKKDLTNNIQLNLTMPVAQLLLNAN